jgi:hypothetical protein
MASYQFLLDKEGALTIWTVVLGSQGLYCKVPRDMRGTSVMVENIMSWISTKMQLVNSYMPLLARGHQSPTPEGGERLPSCRFPRHDAFVLLTCSPK